MRVARMEVRQAESAFAEAGFAGGQRQRRLSAVAIEESYR